MDEDDERPTGRPREQGVIDTDDLDISHDERVAQIESGRYVITTGGNRPPNPQTPASGDEHVGEDTNEGPAFDETPANEARSETDGSHDSDDRPEVVLPRDPRKRAVLARRLLAERVGSIQADHALVATALVDGSVERHEAVSNDVTDVFHSMVQWYADAVGNGDTPTDEVLGILLLASEVQVTYPGRAVAALANAHGLERGDSIGELLDAVAESGASFPPSRSR